MWSHLLTGGLHRPDTLPFPVHRAEPVEAATRVFPLVKPLNFLGHSGLLSPSEDERIALQTTIMTEIARAGYGVIPYYGKGKDPIGDPPLR